MRLNFDLVNTLPSLPISATAVAIVHQGRGGRARGAGDRPSRRGRWRDWSRRWSGGEILKISKTS